ncbi:hypothetical protein [Actinomadura litoris]|uniref:hypothetical protein n=1 Tax=Actinomadura litoris TaxID=2678616 RepID=UPI001FA70CB6|nr:hypothetical protein [Actinomadura litoris]
MSTSDRLLLFLHIGFAIFALGPLTAATMSTPRFIRARNVVVVRLLHRATQIYGILTLGIFVFGMALAKGDAKEGWLSASITLYVVALVLLLLVERDQRKAIHLLEAAVAAPVPAGAGEVGAKGAEGGAERPAAAKGDVAQVQRGRIGAMGGVVALIWLVILVLMVWNG